MSGPGTEGRVSSGSGGGLKTLEKPVVCITYDFDATAVWIHGYDAGDDQARLSQGVYGAEEAVPDLLDMHDRVGVPATVFTPGHTAASHPDIVSAVHDRGHSVQHHGYHHRAPRSFESRSAERREIERGIEELKAVTGSRPTGYRAPDWRLSPHTIDILRELGFRFDSSLAGRAFTPYLVRELDPDPTTAYEPGDRTELLEIPVSWIRDDWPVFHTDGSTGGPPASASVVFNRWRDAFEQFLGRSDTSVFTLTLHPQIIGRPPRLAHLESFLEDIRDTDGVVVATMKSVAAELLG